MAAVLGGCERKRGGRALPPAYAMHSGRAGIRSFRAPQAKVVQWRVYSYSHEQFTSTRTASSRFLHGPALTYEGTGR